MLSLVILLACAEPADPKDSAADPADTAAVDTADSGDTDETAETGDTGPVDTGDSGDTGDTGPVDTGDSGDTGTAPARRVILFVGDGMGFEHVAGGGLYKNGAAGSLAMEALPYAGRVRTASLSGTTDSAAGATALSTGSKTLNDYVGVDEDGADLTTVAEVARSLGLSVGVVTTDELTGATPASFYAHVPDRMDSDAIAADLFANLPDVVLGGGRSDLEDGLAASAGTFQYVEDANALASVTDDGRPLVGVFSTGTFPWVADGYGAEPALADMVDVALRFLEDDPEGFLLVVEGARIDHASHGRDGARVHQETAAFDDAIAAAVAWSSSYADVTLLVTADHECGGLTVSGGGGAGTVPDSEWRWSQHTNADVPVFGMGALAATVDGQRLDNVWVHAILDAAVRGETTVTPPTEVPIVDGWLDDLGAAVTTQAWSSSFGSGYNQLDALRVTTDEDGLRVGIDGVFERGENGVVVLVDVDYGAGTGFGGDVTDLLDATGRLDGAISALPVSAGLAGLGFDVAVGSVGAEEVQVDSMIDDAGLRGLHGDFGAADDLWWLPAIVAHDDGNVALGGAAPDAAATGLTEGGMEILVPWDSLYPTGLPAAGLEIALVAVLVDSEGDWASNQALPPLASADEPGADGATLASVATVEVDATGNVVSGPVVVP